ncbi:hypothetical protein TrRE_jg11639, partial [Triparma retinervis]
MEIIGMEIIRMELVHQNPNIYVYPNFLSQSDLDHIALKVDMPSAPSVVKEEIIGAPSAPPIMKSEEGDQPPHHQEEVSEGLRIRGGGFSSEVGSSQIGFPRIQTAFSAGPDDDDDDDDDEDEGGGTNEAKADAADKEQDKGTDAPAGQAAAAGQGGKKKGKTKKRRRDPNCPKGVKGAFFIFLDEKLPKIRAEFPDLPRKDAMIKVSDMWKALSPEVK